MTRLARRLLILCPAVALLLLCGCEVSVNRYVDVHLAAVAERDGALVDSDGEAAALRIVDDVAGDWQFTRHHTGRGGDGHLRGYERAVQIPGSRVRRWSST